MAVFDQKRPIYPRPAVSGYSTTPETQNGRNGPFRPSMDVSAYRPHIPVVPPVVGITPDRYSLAFPMTADRPAVFSAVLIDLSDVLSAGSRTLDRTGKAWPERQHLPSNGS